MWATEVQLPNTQALRNIGESGEGPIIGIDASHYLEELRYPAKEPLVPALGGYPMTLEATVVKAVNDIESCGCKLYFFFDGLESNHSSSILSNSVKGSLSVSRAFQIYEVGDAEGAIDQFKVSGSLGNLLYESPCSNLIRCSEYVLALCGFKDCTSQKQNSFRCCAFQSSCSSEISVPLLLICS